MMRSENGPILVTGGGGLIGNAVCRQLQERGDHFVAIDRTSRKEEGVEVVACDVSDEHALHAVATRYAPRGIIHCGALSGPMVARDNPFAMVAINIVGTANLLEVARIHGISRFVNCSSTSVYGNIGSSESVREDVSLAPESVYGASKVAGEQLVATYSSQYGLDGVSLRLSWVYGPRRTTECAVRMMIENAIRGVPTHLEYGGGFYRQYIYVDDAARALIAAFDRQRLPRRTYSVTGGTNLSFDQIASAVQAIFPNAHITLKDGPDPNDGIQPAFDISAMRHDVGFKPAIEFKQGVRLYGEWLKANAALEL